MNYIDPLTNEPFTPERSNQRFATRANQIKYNNLKAKKKRSAKSEIDVILDKNRSILNILSNPQRTDKISKDYLLGCGFKFSCITHQINKDGLTYNCIYEFGYAILENNEIKIIKHA